MRRTLVNLGNLGGGGVLTSLVLAVSFLFAANANAGTLTTQDQSGGLVELFTLQIGGTTPGLTLADGVTGPAVVLHDPQATSFNYVNTFSFTLSGLTGVDLTTLKFGHEPVAAYFFTPFTLNGTTLTSGVSINPPATLGPIPVSPGYITDSVFWLTELDSSDTLNLSFIGTTTGTYTITGYGRTADAAAPEPATMLMFGLGIAGVAVARRIRRK